MRHVYPSLVVLAVLLLAFPAAAQWSTQSPIPTDLAAQGIAAPTPDRVFLATDDDSFDDGGALFESADGGVTWTQRDVPFNLNDPLHGVFFLDSQLGWAFGNDNYRTTDGGTTWEELPFLGSTYFMEFYTPTFGYASTNGEAWVSRDGGLSWEVTPDGLFAFAFATDQTGLGVSGSGVYRTTDGGQTFTLVLSGDAAAVAYLTDDVAVAIVDSSFARSTDGGVTWSTGTSAEGRNRLHAVSADVLLAWGDDVFFSNADGRVLRSADGGQTWTDLGVVFENGTRALVSPTPTTVIGMDSGASLYRSADAGLTWTLVAPSPGPRPYYLGTVEPVFADAQTGYIAYGNTYILKTTDGGETWAQVSNGYGESLNDIARFDDGRLIAVGENGTVLTSPGDGTWVLGDTLTTRHLEAVDIVGPQGVVVVDAEGRVYRSADGGDTWTASAATPPNLDAKDVDFTTLLDGWVVGFGPVGGAVFHTTDGGASWTPASGFGGAYLAVDFEGEDGWVLNTSGRYYRTTDGGATWTQGELPDSFGQVRDMDFTVGGVGYAVGWYGFAARSDDGGATWTILPTPTDDDDFTGLYLVGEDELWLSTNDDKAYYSATGGQNWAPLAIGSDGFGTFAAIAATPEGDAWAVGFQGYIEHFAGPPPPPDNRPPEAAFTFEATGLTVAFTDTSTDPDGSVVSWFWDFDDSTPDSTSTEQHPTHTFPEAGTYLVRLTVTDDDGATDLALRAVVAQPGPGGVFGAFTEVTPLDTLFVTPQDEDFVVATTAPADFDGDGDLDIAVLGFYVVYNTSVDYRLVLMRNDGEASPTQWALTYLDVPLGDMTTGASDLAWGDADGDGDQDLLVGTDGETALYRNDDGTLVRTDTALPGYYEDNDQADFDLRSITWADYDNDGDLDLLLPSVFDFDSTFTYRTALMRNDGPNGTGGWTFTETDSVFTATGHAQSQWADYDADGDLDLLLVHLAPLTDDGFIRIYRNDGGGAFVGEDVLGTLTVEHGEAHWGDYDADGDYDILIAGHIKETDGSFNQVLRIYRNEGAGSYAETTLIDAPNVDWLDLTAATWADYDSDGDVDILLAGTYNSGSQIDGRARIYANENGTYVESGNDLPAPRASGTRGGSFTWLDIDGEGDLDYFIAGEYFVPGGNGLVETQMHLYRNDTDSTNAAPTAPTGLTATVGDPGPDGRTVTLAWNPASDDSTPADALTYDLDLRLQGTPVATPRRLPEPGSVSAVTGWSVAGLADGTYTWSVRAVDSAYNGGPVAEGTFAVGVTTSTEGDGDLPRAYALEATYPNPFRRATTLRYALPEAAEVALSVYDLLGRLVVHLVQGERPAGYHTVRWDADGLASGTYLVRFSTDAFTTTRRVLLVR